MGDADRIADLERQRAEAHAALEPFARAGAAFGTEENSCIEDNAAMLEATAHASGFVDNLSVGDFRRAHAVLAAALTTRRSACDEESERADKAERLLAEMRRVLNRIARGAELQAHVMRDWLRTAGWAGAERVADAFDDIAERARAAIQTPEAKNPPG